MVRVGGDGASSTRQGMAPEVGPAPAVRRLRSSRWRDPRLAVGVVLVAGSVVVGARVVAAADDTVPVWSLRNDVPSGAELTADDVTITRVHFDDAGDAERYFDGGEPIPDELVVGHDLLAGELLTRSALVEPESEEISEVPLPVADGLYPPDLATGDLIDVWVMPSDEADGRATVTQLLDDVPVLRADVAEAGLGDTDPVVVVGLDSGDASSLEATLEAIPIGSLTLIRQGA